MMTIFSKHKKDFADVRVNHLREVFQVCHWYEPTW
jgi:hypothetical protein